MIDTAPDLISTLNLVLAGEGLPAVAYDDARLMIGGGPRRMIERALIAVGRNVPGVELDRMFRIFTDHYSEHIADRSRPTAAQEAIDEQIDPEHLEQIRTEAAAKLEELRETVERINEQLHLAADHFELPDIEVPEPEVELDPGRQALVSFDHDWVCATGALIKHKAYGK